MKSILKVGIFPTRSSYILTRMFCLVLLAAFFSCTFKASTSVYDLRVEHRKNPVGVGILNPRFSWKIESDETNQVQSAYQILVASSPDLLNSQSADLWNSRETMSSQSILVDYDGTKLSSRQRCWWSVRIWDKNGHVTEWSDPAYFEMGLLNSEDWEADWIRTAIEFDEYSHPSPFLRNEFILEKSVESARLYATSKGLYEFYINGEIVGDLVFTPGFTSFDKRLQYQVYDITTILKNGTNAAGVILGNGFYRVYHPNNRPSVREIQDLEVLAQIEIMFTDGTSQIIGTGNTWRSSTGPIIKSEIFNGEIYDARKEHKGWDKPGFDDSGWEGTIITQSAKDNLVWSISEPVRRIAEIEPIGIIYTPEGDTLFDMGQNMVGWCRLKVDCPAGTTITLRHAEVLDQNGNFYTGNLRDARQEIIYTCRGGGATEIFEPSFTFHGFRYVKISGYPGEVTEDMVTGIVVHSDLEMTGHFSCNNNLINKLQQNIVWSQRGNFFDVPLDCPQRNERMGWTGDAQLFAPTACFNMNSATFFTKWLKDLALDQHENGKVPNVIPDEPYNPLSSGVSGWADAALIVPWNLYLNYGDLGILQEQYESMKGWVEFMRETTYKDYLWRTLDERYAFGDWMSLGTPTDKDLLAAAYFYYSTGLLRKTAEILGKTGDVSSYGELQSGIKKAFNEEFVLPDGSLSSNTQTAYVVALSFGLLPGDLEEAAAERLAEIVNEYNHLTTGFLGTPDLLHILVEYGYLEEAYKLMYRQEYPSWLYMVNNGATTIWERWDGITTDGRVRGSHNHYLYGSVGDWLYKVVAGINPDPEFPGYKKTIIKPRPWGEMNDVSSSHESPYGTLSSEWQIEDDIMKLTVQIPVNTSAEIYIPATDSFLKVNGIKQKEVQTIAESGFPYQFIHLTKGSGRYIFETKLNLTGYN